MVRGNEKFLNIGHAEFMATVYGKSLVECTHNLIVYLAKVFKFGMIYALAYQCFKVISDWSQFHEVTSIFKE